MDYTNVVYGNTSSCYHDIRGIQYFVSPGLSEGECRARAIAWCTRCKNYDPTFKLGDGTPMEPELLACAKKYYSPLPIDCGPGSGLIPDTDRPADVWCAAFITIPS